MNLQEIIEKWEKEIAKIAANLEKTNDNYSKCQYLGELTAISAILCDLKKLNETIVSEEKKCETFLPDYMSSSQTKCQFCGREKHEHF